MNQGIHYIDMLQFLVGPVAEVTGHCGTFGHTGLAVEDTAAAAIKFQSGALGVVEGTTCAYPGLVSRIDVYGTEGSAVIENDVRLGAMGERWKGSARGVNDFVFLAIGTGIAAGICVNGELLRGPGFAAGEVGYLIVPGTREDAVPEGHPGALESAIGGEGIRAQWKNGTQRMYGEALYDLSATDIFERATNGNEQAQSVLERSARILAHTIYDISVVLNCPLFILGGGVGMSVILRDATESILKKYSQPVRPQLRLSSLGPDAQLFGALRLALDAAEKKIGLKM